jgi:excinuclease ABC subunit C
VFLTRQKIDDGSQYFGPYTSISKVRDLLNFIKQTVPLRTCALNLTERNQQRQVQSVPRIPLGNCSGPCEAHQSEEAYKRKHYPGKRTCSVVI